MHIETLAIHAARKPDAASAAVSQPIHLSTTFERAADGGYPQGHYYARAGNPNRQQLEQAIARCRPSLPTMRARGGLPARPSSGSTAWCSRVRTRLPEHRRCSPT